MKDFLLHMAQSSICLIFFLGIYFLFLRKQTFFRFNRAFLMVGLVLSFIIPAIKITYEVVLPHVEMYYELSDYPIVSTEESTNIWQFLAIIYAVGATLIIIRNFNIFKKLNKLRKTGNKSFTDGYCLVEHSKIETPFSVFNNIFINTENLQSKEKEVILKHEISHICQKHWIDLLFSECALLLQWFNPMLWYYIHLQKENHEYLADQAVLDNGESIAVYRAVLVNQQFRGPIFSFANSFNYSNQQNRLNMMKKTKTSPWKKIAAIAVLPLLGVFITLSAKPYFVIKQNNNIAEHIFETINDSTSHKTANLIKDSITIIGVADGKVAVRGVSYTNSKDKPLVIIDGKESSMQVLEKTDSKNIESISVFKDTLAIEQYGEKGQSGVIRVVTKTVQKNNDHKAITIGVEKSVQLNLKHGEDINGAASIVKILTDDTLTDASNLNKPLIIIDGREAVGKEINNIDAKSIKKIDVLKGKNAIEKYGEKGVNGVVIITTAEGME